MYQKEIERKYLPTVIPNDLPIINVVDILQQYLSEDESPVEIRVRKKVYRDGRPTEYSLDMKMSEGIDRDEYSYELDEKRFEYCLSLVKTRKPIRKTRVTYEYNGYKLEKDTFQSIDGFSLVEIEFPSVEEAEAFQPPHWLIELTDETSFRNRNLWRAINADSLD